jgi:hypothetical protein
MIRRTLAVLAASLFALAGCSDVSQAPLAPVAPPEASSALLSGLVDLDGVLKFAGVPNLLQPRHAEKRITASQGGFVELHGFRVDIPAGALPQDTVVTIDLPLDLGLSKRVMAEFGPHGIQFNTPVTLSFPLSGVNVGTGPLEVGRWENGGWTGLGGWLSSDGLRLYGTTPRFSTYAARAGHVMAGG